MRSRSAGEGPRGRRCDRRGSGGGGSDGGRSDGCGDAGSATAELAVALPAVALVLAACVWGVSLAAVQVRLQDAAGLAARSAARGDDLGAASAAMPQADFAVGRDGDLVCVTARVDVRTPVADSSVPLVAVSCMLVEVR